LGCFTSVAIGKGERVWEFHPIIDRVIRHEDLACLPRHVVSLVHTHAEYLPDQGTFRLAADGDFFMNHSDDPNIEDHGDFAVARKDIAASEELTWDYRIVRVVSFPMPLETEDRPTQSMTGVPSL
jgi:SET domain-containing protein